ncbi:MAG TPA: ribonuclease H [Kofleriaceae bacterium]|nr:ribonuclease H [Kofleriaceae bacterium]
MRWAPHTLRGKSVYVRINADGQPVTDERGLVDVVYKLAPGAKLYRASARNLGPAAGDAVEADLGALSRAPERNARKPSAAGNAIAPPPEDAVIAYTDGACRQNPGPMGIGVVISDAGERREISEYLGHGTNNIAELTAIARALEVTDEMRQRPLYLYTDSSYAIGVLSKGWKAKANGELIATIRAALEGRPVTLVKVAGHAGVPDNERADKLATEAADRRS